MAASWRKLRKWERGRLTKFWWTPYLSTISSPHFVAIWKNGGADWGITLVTLKDQLHFGRPVKQKATTSREKKYLPGTCTLLQCRISRKRGMLVGTYIDAHARPWRAHKLLQQFIATLGESSLCRRTVGGNCVATNVWLTRNIQMKYLSHPRTLLQRWMRINVVVFLSSSRAHNLLQR